MNFLQLLLLLGAQRASSSAGQTRAAAARRRRDDELYLTRFLISQWDAASTRLPSIWNGGRGGKEFKFSKKTERSSAAGNVSAHCNTTAA